MHLAVCLYSSSAGKGFAVVAQEVRELALRCSGAAKEIGGLIGNSAVSVATARAWSTKPAKSCAPSPGSFSALTSMWMRSPTGRAALTALSEVSTAVVEMGKATQQNAAMVEEMTWRTSPLLRTRIRSSTSLSRISAVADAGARRDGRAGRAAAASPPSLRGAFATKQSRRRSPWPWIACAPGKLALSSRWKSGPGKP